MDERIVNDQLDEYWDFGWNLVPIEPGSKSPPEGKEFMGWQNFDVEEGGRDAFREKFKGRGVGLILGASSLHTVDVDLDCEEAVMFGREMLDPTTLRLGHAHAPASHYLYQCPDLSGQYKAFIDPMSNKRIVELRGKGQQLIPPTIHPDHDVPYEWYGDRGLVAPVRVEENHLRADVHLLAVLTLMARHWEDWASIRHDLWMAFCGGLLRHTPSYWGREGVLEGVSFMFGDRIGYHDVTMLVGAARTTLQKHEKGANYTGWQTMYEILKGDYSPLVDRVREWIEEAYPDERDTDPADEVEPEPDEEEVEGLASLVYTATELLAVEVPPAEWLIEDYIMRGEITSLLGDKGVGKSLLCLAWANQMAENGERVLYYDEENGIPTMQTRYKDLLIASDNLLYMDFPGLALASPETLVNFMQMIRDLRITVVIIDSVVDVANVSRLSINDNGEMALLYRNVFARFRQEGLTVILQDHKPASKEKKGKGVTEKGDLVQVEWDVSSPPGKSFSRDKSGELVLEVVKDRQGYCGARGDRRKIRVLTEGRDTVEFRYQTRSDAEHDDELRRSVGEMNDRNPLKSRAQGV